MNLVAKLMANPVPDFPSPPVFGVKLGFLGAGCKSGMQSSRAAVKTVAVADIIFLVDSSWSIGKEHFQLVREFLYDVVKALDVGGNDFRFALVQFSGNPHTEFQLNTYPSTRDVLSHIANMPYMGGGTKTGKGLEYLIENHLTKAAGSRASEGVPQVIIVLTDGRSQDDVALPSSVLKSAHVNMFAVGVQDAVEGELKEIASEPFDMHLFNLENFTALHGIVGDLVASVRSSMTPEKAGAKGLVKDITVIEVNKKDVVFLIDGSTALGTAPFNAIRDFVAKIVQRLEVGPDLIQVAVAQYADTVKPEFYFNTHQSRKDVMANVKKMKLMGGTTLNTGSALDFVRNNFFTSAAGCRMEEGVLPMLVLITGGKSRDAVDQAAAEMKRNRIVTLAIGSRNADLEELQEIAHERDFVFNPNDFRVQFMQAILPEVLSPIRTLSGGLIVQEPPSVQVTKRDIIFLLDGSPNVGNANFPFVRDFVATLVNYLDVGSDKIRVGLVQFSDTPKTEFFLYSYQTKSDIIQHMGQLRPKGGSVLNTGSALNFVLSNHFTEAGGSRINEQVPQVLVLVTAGRSADPFLQVSNELARAGVLTFAVGVRSADKAELEQIAFNPRMVYFMDDFSALAALPQELNKPITTYVSGGVEEVPLAPAVVERSEKKDVVFLIDGSDGVRSGFPLLKTFVQRVVESLDIGRDKVRVAVAQYSNVIQPEFLLDTHEDKADLISAIQELKVMGGSPLNTGAALDYLIKNVFTVSSGSRIAEGVPQFLILLTADRSQDDVRRPSVVLKTSGTVPFGIGIGNADLTELQTISFLPDFAISVPDFSQLDTVQQVISNRVIRLTKKEIESLAPDLVFTSPSPAGVKRDVVFMVDGSRYAAQEFYLIRDLIERIVNNLDVGFDTTRISVVQFSEHPRVEFLLNAHSTKDEVQNAVRRLRPQGGQQVNLGEALEFVAKTIFTRPSGSRIEEGVPQFLIILSSRKSDDDLEYPSLQVKQVGVAPMVVAKNMDPEEMVQISLSPDYVFQVSSFQELPSLEQKLLTPIETLTGDQIRRLLGDVQPPIGGKKQADIVFLLDGSINLGRDNFQEVLQFVYSVVDAIYRDGDSIQVGLAQYNSDVTDEFFLKDYSTKPEILDAINKVIYKGGRVANTGAAIKHIQAKHFVKEAGSRIDQRVPQIAFIVTGGKSSDDGPSASLEITQKGVKVFAVGVRNIDLKEVSRLASESAMSFRASTAQELSELNEQVLVTLEAAMEEKLCPGTTDVTRVMQLEFGRGFTYNRPLRVNLLDLDFELAEQLDNIAERTCCKVPCKCSGQRGDRGVPGPIGPKGERGPPGVNGTQGFQGCPGHRGTKGSRGFPGEKGELGEMGLDGIDGEEGEPGPAGLEGQDGAVGRKGMPGRRGPIGVKGEPGNPGPKGPNGQQGPRGEMGDDGRDGIGGPGPKGRKINNTAVGHAIVLPTSGAQLNETIRRLLTCHICLDVCDPDPSCGFGSERPVFRDKRAAPTDVDTDIAFIMDSSESTTPLQFSEMKKYISHLVSNLEISSEPKVSQHHARVAVLQQAPYEYETNSSFPPVKTEFSLTDYGSKEKIINYLHNQMTQLHGTRAMGSAIEHTMAHIFESAPNSRDLKVIVLMLTGKVNKQELEYLQKVVIDAKCKGYFFVVLGIGRKVNAKNIYSLASEPNDVFFKLVDKPGDLHEEPLLRFGRLLPSFIRSK
ncbi:collagen alpha-3 chain isoform x3 [Limosa lapponica baueri]|uniref:Collagen alpha-3(VI) chain n=1 Tax=Limosa lapponica baueri TaxID=1758121 RepID=A0A2I0TM28_LIMLA|nr:collagen alpha-3 chain isoform x3 [Limosa lapponica baueri]